MSLIIRKCTISEIESDPNIAALLDEYATELVIDGLPHPSAKMEMYRQLEGIGSLQSFGAYFDNILVGLINVLMVTNPHYGVAIGVTESYFVMKEFRKTGAGLKLRREAEWHAQSLSSPGLFVSAPAGGPLAESLSHSKEYTETGRVFFRKLQHA